MKGKDRMRKLLWLQWIRFNTKKKNISIYGNEYEYEYEYEYENEFTCVPFCSQHSIFNEMSSAIDVIDV